MSLSEGIVIRQLAILEFEFASKCIIGLFLSDGNLIKKLENMNSHLI